MKTICLIIGIVFSSIVASAQIASPGFKNKELHGSLVDRAATFAVPKAKQIGQSSFGKIYALPQDNMPCLVPPTPVENAMPVLVPPVTNLFMPNPVPRQNVIPNTLSKRNIFKIKKAPQQQSENLMLDLIRKK